MSVHLTADGGYVIAGYTSSGMDSDVLLIKTNDRGDTLWTKTYGGTDQAAGYSVEQTTDGGYAVTGWFASLTGPYVYLIKTDVDGDTMWTRTFGTASQNTGYSVQQTADGGYVIAGYTWNNYTDVYLIRTDENGDTLWTKCFGSLGYDIGQSVQQTADGGYVIAGYAESSGHSHSYVYLVKTDASGNVAVAEPKAKPTRASTLSLTCEPNPCRGVTRISLTPQASSSRPLTLRMYDSQGRRVLSREVSTSSFPLSISDFPSGAYFLRCDAAGKHATARVVLQH